jgi:hypothetical protein
MGLQFGLDVAFCDEVDEEMVVTEIIALRPWRVNLPRLRTRMVVEAQAGAFERWGLRVGDRLELRG